MATIVSCTSLFADNLECRQERLSAVFRHPKFEVQISRHVQITELGWPKPGEANNERYLGCNREYMDLRRLSWTEARRVLADEAQLIARIEKAKDFEAEYSKIEEEYDDGGPNLFGLDIGVASTVVALSAARCVPFSSCGAAAFGGNHHEAYPVVALYAKPESAKLLLAIANEVDIGIQNGEYGCLVVFSDDIEKFPLFAEALICRRREFNAMRLSSLRASKPSAGMTHSTQYRLPL